MIAPPPLSLYVHLPWCVRKCPYCDFNSWQAGDSPPRARYLDALIKDLGNEAERAGGRELISVFLGGGTPSLFTPAEIGRLIDAVAANFRLAEDVEVTMEANPGTVECGAPAGYLKAGVNRLSIGAQSFDDASLKRLGRIHAAADIARAVRDAEAAGFERINVDLMYALPEQSAAAACADLDAAIALGPEHISWYQLTLEPNTVFYARPPAGLPAHDEAFAIGEAGAERLRAAGFSNYEVSAWARAGAECRHNLNYWSFGDYLAVGAGAHGKLTAGDGVHRYQKPAHPRAYMESVETGPAMPLPPPLDGGDLVFEYALNALRLERGFSEAEFAARTGLDAGSLAERAAGVLERGLIRRDEAGRWTPTALGRRFLDDLQAAFLP